MCDRTSSHLSQTLISVNFDPHPGEPISQTKTNYFAEFSWHSGRGNGPHSHKRKKAASKWFPLSFKGLGDQKKGSVFMCGVSLLLLSRGPPAAAATRLLCVRKRKQQSGINSCQLTCCSPVCPPGAGGVGGEGGVQNAKAMLPCNLADK